MRTNRFMTRLASGIVAVAAAAATTVLIGGVASAAVLPDDHTVTTTALVMAPSSSAQTLTARLTPATARGSVQFMDGVTPLGNPVPVTNGTGTITLTLPAGEHSLSAVFNPTDRTPSTDRHQIPSTATSATSRAIGAIHVTGTTQAATEEIRATQVL